MSNPKPDGPVTRSELKAELDVFKSELRTEITTLFKVQHDYIDERFKVQGAYIDERFREQHDYIDERTRDMQTELLRGFRSYQETTSIKLAKLGADVGNIDTATDKRIAVVEQRPLDLERKIAQKGL